MQYSCVLDYLNTISYVISSIVSVIILIGGIIYVNKKLKLYIYKDKKKQLLIISAFERGNGACKLEDVVFTLNKNDHNLSDATISDDKMFATIDLSGVSSDIIYIIAFDNFGRKYEKKYRTK